MKKEDILNILNDEIMIVEDQAGNKITCIESCDFDDIADAILRLRGVSCTFKENDIPNFEAWKELRYKHISKKVLQCKHTKTWITLSEVFVNYRKEFNI